MFDMQDDEDFEDWKLTYLNHYISLLTGELRDQWNGFAIEDLCLVYRQLYHICNTNWIPGEESDDRVQERLRLFGSLVMRKHVNFSELLLSQIHYGVSNLLDDSDVCLPNFIHQIPAHQREVSHMLDDDKLMGESRCLNEFVFI